MNILLLTGKHNGLAKVLIQVKGTVFISLLTALLLFTLMGCGQSQKAPNLYQVKKQRFEIKIPAFGELFAAKATVISAPASGHGSQNLAWLAPEYARVKKGDIIARFDGEVMDVQRSLEQIEISLTEQDLEENYFSLALELNAINQEINMIHREANFAKRFSIDDVRIRSRLEILDASENSDFLEAKLHYLKWKKASFEQTSLGDIDLLKMKHIQSTRKIAQLKKDLSMLEIKAPHEGLLIYSADWRGEKPKEGKLLWPGQKMAELPDVSKMKAKLFVFEHEASGLAPGQKVELNLYAFSKLPFSGVVETVASFPASIKRADPQKYFEVVVTLDKQQTELFVPGRKLTASISVTEPVEKIVVPRQSLFSEDNKPYVYLFNNGEYYRQYVTLGQSSLSHVEVMSGLAENQQIALIKVEGS
ncbi:HlyD family efflux transporter periplasmic adaptor subunit [Thalassomonas viridans]|uniref:HlyD family efflux transporter periplasmic adaptor subunit n=1 Tax=Thalassomonas viridans TaxID=137584 RepID=A0AAF0CD98_9GAMM|nr:HlyD family efflux transporter periplasmic adaptor subunit [Thalassomonas viridans]WDE08626.1 HlyD family efflux transporter periplasmic adaptor subunit [Thalassomonas viridans]